MSDVTDSAQHPHPACHNAALEPEDDEGAPSVRRPLSLDRGEQAHCALGIDVIEREPGARAAWELQPTSRRTEVAPDVLDAHAQRHQVEDGDGEPHIPGPSVDAGAPDGLPRVFSGRPERPESRAGHERRNAEQVGGRDRKSTRLNSSHGYISYAVFCLKKKKKNDDNTTHEV